MLSGCRVQGIGQICTINVLGPYLIIDTYICNFHMQQYYSYGIGYMA